jgi:membrane protease YdiL (CAAX protease family)
MNNELSPFALFIAAVISFVLMAAVAWAFGMWRKVRSMHLFPKDKRLKWLVAAYPAILVAEYIGLQFYPVAVDPDMERMLSSWSIWQTIIVIVIAAPLAEEYIFRGVVLVWLHRTIGEFGAAILSALAWASLHTQYDLIWMGAIAASGVLLAYIRMRGGSLALVIAIHAANNAIALTGI